MVEAVTDQPSDEMIIRHLGAATLLCWHALPLAARQQVLDQSTDVVGFASVADVRSHIVKLAIRHAPRKEVPVPTPAPADV